MAVPQILTGATPVPSVGPAGGARPEAAPFQAAPGTSFDAEVVQVQTPPGGASAALASAAVDGRLQTQVMLRLGGALLAATLPGTPPQVGSRLPLVYLGTANGQPQFLLAPQQAQTAAAQPQLSGPGQLLGLLQQMQTAAAASQPGMAATQGAAATLSRPGQTTPVWTQPGQPAAQAAQLLADALRGSGLFYESQLGAWAQGKQPLSTLLQQPQGQLSPLLQQAAAPPPTAAPSPPLTSPPTAHAAPQPAPLPTAPQPTPDAAPAPRHAALAAYGAVQAQPQAATDPAVLAARLPTALHGIVQQQLQTLMQGQAVWEGVLWPGQPARWTLRPDPEDDAEPGATPQSRGWSTQIDLDLPQLGTVQARLHLRGARVDLTLHHSEAAQARMDAALPQLRAALQSAGLVVGGIQHAPLQQPSEAAS